MEEICAKCSKSLTPHTFAGFPCFPRIQIYQFLLAKMCETEKHVTSGEVALSLKQGEEEVKEAMQDLCDEYASMFEFGLNIDTVNIEVSELGKVFLAQALPEIIESGLTYDGFQEFYPTTLASIAINNHWIRVIHSKNKVVVGAQIEEYEELYEMLMKVSVGRSIPELVKRKLYCFKLLDDTKYYWKIKKTNDFPNDRNKVTSIYKQMIGRYMLSVNQSAVEK